jgi:hypothetical protein
MEARTPEQIHPGLKNQLRNHVDGDRYWTYREKRGGPLHVVHHAGWQKTLSTPNDLGGIKMQCRVFCHFGCSTFLHNQPIIRNKAGWKHEGNEKYAYFTRRPAYALTFSRWIANLITYDVENAFKSWEGSLDHAVRRTNKDIRAANYRYIIV